jgi:site-specific DNA recombinase
MDGSRRVALYARVSSQRQAESLTIASQVAAVRERIADDGDRVDEDMCFLDEGISGSTLVRPALERLRDLAWAGGVDRLYVHSPDRLARKYAYQVLLLEEFAKGGIEVIFLNHDHTSSPEGDLLLQMQGMIAEYERAKILERTRRGRRFAAQQGKVSVLSHAPYGYRYVPKDSGDDARYEIVPEQAAVVREVFEWVGVEGLSLAAAVRRLHKRHVPTATGLQRWDRTTVRGLLRNPAYCGAAMYGKTRLLPRKTRHRPRRGDPETPRRDKVGVRTEAIEPHTIVVPAIVSRELFDTVAEQLASNRRHHRARVRQQFLLSGLLVCGRCGSAYCGQRQRRRDGTSYTYYRCLGTDRHRFAGDKLCLNPGLNGARLEAEVWSDVASLLQDPDQLRRELERRQAPSRGERPDTTHRPQTIAALKRRMARLLDAYEHGFMEQSEFASRMARVKDQLTREEAAWEQEQQTHTSAAELRLYLTDFENFAEQIRQGLNAADTVTRQSLLRLLVKRIEVHDEQIRMIYKVQPPPFVPRPARSGAILHNCWRRQAAALQNAKRPPKACCNLLK